MPCSQPFQPYVNGSLDFNGCSLSCFYGDSKHMQTNSVWVFFCAISMITLLFATFSVANPHQKHKILFTISLAFLYLLFIIRSMSEFGQYSWDCVHGVISYTNKMCVFEGFVSRVFFLFHILFWAYDALNMALHIRAMKRRLTAVSPIMRFRPHIIIITLMLSILLASISFKEGYETSGLIFHFCTISSYDNIMGTYVIWLLLASVVGFCSCVMVIYYVITFTDDRETLKKFINCKSFFLLIIHPVWALTDSVITITLLNKKDEISQDVRSYLYNKFIGKEDTLIYPVQEEYVLLILSAIYGLIVGLSLYNPTTATSLRLRLESNPGSRRHSEVEI